MSRIIDALRVLQDAASGAVLGLGDGGRLWRCVGMAGDQCIKKEQAVKPALNYSSNKSIFSVNLFPRSLLMMGFISKKYSCFVNSAKSPLLCQNVPQELQLLSLIE